MDNMDPALTLSKDLVICAKKRVGGNYALSYVCAGPNGMPNALISTHYLFYKICGPV